MRISDWSSDVCSSDLIEVDPVKIERSGARHRLSAVGARQRPLAGCPVIAKLIASGENLRLVCHLHPQRGLPLIVALRGGRKRTGGDQVRSRLAVQVNALAVHGDRKRSRLNSRL